MLEYDIYGLKAYRTCLACPQQYDVYKENKQVGYLRLRHGKFTVSCPDVGGTIVYVAYPKGDGMFHIEEELTFITEALNSINTWLNEKI